MRAVVRGGIGLLLDRIDCMARRQVRVSLGGLTVRYADCVEESIPWVDLGGSKGSVHLVAEARGRYRPKPLLVALPTVLFHRLRQRQLCRLIRSTGWQVECSAKGLRDMARARSLLAGFAALYVVLLPVTLALPLIRDPHATITSPDAAVVGAMAACSAVLLALFVPAALREARQLRSLVLRCPATLSFEMVGVRIAAQDGVECAAWDELCARLDVPEVDQNSDLLSTIYRSPIHGGVVRDAMRAMCPKLAQLEARRHWRMGGRQARLVLVVAAIGELVFMAFRTVFAVPAPPPGAALGLGAVTCAVVWLVCWLLPDGEDTLAWRLHRWQRRWLRRRRQARGRS